MDKKLTLDSRATRRTKSLRWIHKQEDEADQISKSQKNITEPDASRKVWKANLPDRSLSFSPFRGSEESNLSRTQSTIRRPASALDSVGRIRNPGFSFSESASKIDLSTIQKTASCSYDSISKRSNRASLGGLGAKPGSLEYSRLTGLELSSTKNETTAGTESQPPGCEEGPAVASAAARLPQVDPSDSAQPDAADEWDTDSAMSEREADRARAAARARRYRELMPGHEPAGLSRENAHLRRVLQSADDLFPVRHAYCVACVIID